MSLVFGSGRTPGVPRDIRPEGSEVSEIEEVKGVE